MRFSPLPSFAAVLIPILMLAGCGAPPIDVANTVKITNVTTGWFDAGVVSGMNKLVPSASFTVTNSGATRISSLQVFSVFRFLGDAEELGSSMIVLHDADALAANATSKPLTVRAIWGFTGQQPRAQMLMHRDFRDARVEIFAKYGSGQYIRLTETPIRRQILTQ